MILGDVGRNNTYMLQSKLTLALPLLSPPWYVGLGCHLYHHSEQDQGWKNPISDAKGSMHMALLEILAYLDHISGDLCRALYIRTCPT